MGNSLDVTKWKTEEIYKALVAKKTDEGEKIRVPVFQRGLCWSFAEEERLIDSLYKSFPIGSLLFYKKTGLNEYVLIDGLQRANTIKKFFISREMYFKMEYLSEETNKLISSIEETYEIFDFSDYSSKLIRDYIHDNKKDSSFFNDAFLDKYDIADNSFFKQINLLSGKIVLDLHSFQDISEYEVPVIIFSSDNNEVISEIFKRINTEGKQLSIFDIYASSWDKTRFFTDNDEIINIVINRYNNYLTNGLEVDDYDENNMKSTKEVNAFEYVFGLGKLIKNRFNTLFETSPSKDSEVDQLAFDLLNVCYGNSPKDMNLLDRVLLSHSDNIDLIFEAINESCEYVTKLIKPYIYFKANNQKKDIKILHSYWQILSLIAYVFKKIYDLYSDHFIESKESIKSDMVNRLRMYYVYDILSQNWREGNIGFAYKCVKEYRYDDELTKSMFSSALDSHFEMQLNYKEIKSVGSVTTADYIVLNTIYQNIFTAQDQLDDTIRFDVEHLCPKKRMSNLIKEKSGSSEPDSSYGLPISSIANLCYLPSNINRSKKILTIYEDTISDEDIVMLENNYTFTNKDDMDWISNKELKFDDFKVQYFSFLRKRYVNIKKKFLTSLGFNFSLDDEHDLEIKGTKSIFDDLLVGKVAQKVFSELIDKKLLDDDEIENLMNKDYCNENFKLSQYPVFSETRINNSNKFRYYSIPLKYKNRDLYLTSEWYDISRDLIINYYYVHSRIK